MTEEQSERITVHPRLSSLDPSFIPNHTPGQFWLQQLDMNSYDFIYIDQMLARAYESWQEETSQLGSSNRCAIYNYNSDLIASNWTAEEDILSDELQRRIEACRSGGESAEVVLENGSGAQVIYLIPLMTRSQAECFAVMAVLLPFQGGGKELAQAMSLHYRSCFYNLFENVFTADLLLELKIAEEESERRTMLLKAVQRMHNHIDVDNVLSELLDSIEMLYPWATLQLFMSQDHLSNSSRVKQLVFQGPKKSVSTRTFMSGKLIIEEVLQEEERAVVEIGIPLGSKQGTYGVFHLEVPKDRMKELDVPLVTTMVDAAGNAFENARLYEQSNLLIQELRIINELTHKLNESLQLSDIYQYANKELLHIFKADYCCILQYQEEQDGLKVVSSNVQMMMRGIVEKDYGFAGQVFMKGEPIIVSNYSSHGKVRSQLMERTGSLSLIASPLMVKGEVRGAILIADQRAEYFSYNNYKLLQTLAIHIGLAVSNATLHAQVRRMANRDVLTDLYARHYMDEVIDQSQQQHYQGALIVIDIDQFKQVNDTFGHQTGDSILKKVSDIVRRSIRQDDVPARWGGEELAVYLPQLNVDQAAQIAENIRFLVEKDTSPPVTISCGISSWNRQDGQICANSLFHRADMALYRAKNNGRNQVQVEEREVIQ